MENKIRELSNANRRKRLLKRVVAFLSIVVLLFTVNSLKLTAITLSRVPACGLKKHIHKAKCYDGNGNLICGKVEHQHTDACYQVAPNDLTLEIEGDGVAVDEPSLDLSLSLDDGVLQVDDSALQLDDSLLELDNPPVDDAGSGAQTNSSQKPTYELGERAKLSKIIKKTGIEVNIGEVNEVGVVDYDGTQASLLSIEQIDGDYIIAAARDFDEADLAIIAEKGIEVVRLVGGRMPAEVVEQGDPQTSSEVAEETPSEVAEQNPSEAAEQGDVQTDVQATEETDPQIDVQTDLQAGAESTEDEISSDIVVDDQVAVDDFNGGESDALALDLDDAVVVQQQGGEAHVEEQGGEAPAEEQGGEAPVEEQGGEAPVEDQGGIIVTEAEVPADEQGEETPAEEQVGEVETPADVQGEETPAEEQDEETPAEEQAGDVEAPADTQADEEEQSIQQSDMDEVAVEVQDGGIEVEAPADIQGVEAPVDVQGVEAPVEEQGGVEAPVDVQGDDDEALAEEQGVEALADVQGVEASADVQGVETPADVQGDDDEALAEEQGVEAPADTQSDEEDQSVQQSDQVEALVDEQADEQADEVEQSVQQSDMDEVAADTQVEEEEQADEEETLTDAADEAPAEEEDQADEEEQAAEEENASEEDVEAEEEQPAEEELADESAEEEQADEVAEEEQADEEEQPTEEEQGDEAAEEEQVDVAPVAAIYSATIDLSEVETYPISLMEIMAKAVPSDAAEDQPEAIDDTAAADEEAKATVETAEEAAAEEEVEAAPEASAWTIEYDTSLFSIEAVEDDYLIAPIQSFERTQIIVTNDSRYELTLVNCVLADESKDETVEQEAAFVYVATIDLTDVEAYPLSLNEMMSAARAEQPDEEQAQEQAQDAQPDETEEQTQDEQLALNIEYDENLLSTEIVGDDHLITPVQSFERTVITVENDGRYELTLVNCALTEDEAEAEAESNDGAFPAQDFEGQTDYIRVVVSAPAGAFPAGTTMKVVDVADEKTLTDIEDTVSEEFVEVRSVHAVDITFTDVDGNEIEPLTPISVVMSLVESEQIQKAETVVVHVDDEGTTQVVESESAGEAVVSMEMSAGEQRAADHAAEEAEGEPAEEAEGESRAFQADSFSIYAMVQTEAIETRYIAADGTTWNISVGYGKEAEIPAGASLAVSEVVGEDAEAYLAQTAEALRGKETITLARFFDITILDSEGQEVQPKAAVEVKAVLADGTQETVKAVHFAEEGPEIIEASQDDEAVVFEAEGFSVYGIVYTVDFHYGVDGQTYEFTLPGGGAVGMRELAPALGLVEDGEDAIDLFVESIEGIAFSDEELVKPVPVEMNMTVGALKQKFDLESEYSAELTEAQIAELNDKVLQAPDWALVSLKPFDTEETLTITMKNGEAITVAVTDAQLSREVITASGETYVITVTYGDDAQIPEGAELKVREILPVDDEYADYLEEAKKAAFGEVSADEATEEVDAGEEAAEANEEGEYARFFDIEIWANEQKVEPAALVTVDIALADAPRNGEELKVVHFDEADGPVVMQTEAGEEDVAAETAKVRFKTDSFSIYAIIKYGADVRLEDLGGRTCTISRNGNYLLPEMVETDNLTEIKKGAKTSAAIWHFESTGQQNEYYIYTYIDGVKHYIELTQYNPSTGAESQVNAKLQQNWKSSILVERNGDGTYKLSAIVSGSSKRFYLNEWGGEVKQGFAGWHDPNAEENNLTLDFGRPPVQDGKQYVALAKYNDEYYVIGNDGSLTKTLSYNPDDNSIIAENPVLWTVEGPSYDRHIYINTEAVAFDSYNQLATDFYRRYLDPSASNAITEENEQNMEGCFTDNGTKLGNRSSGTIWSNTQLKTIDDWVFKGEYNEAYHLGAVVENGVPVRVCGLQNAQSGVPVFFAQATRVPDAWWSNHTVNHIDIGIKGDSMITVPLAYGTYYYEDADGNMREYVVSEDISLDLTQKDVIITPDDMKRATIKAFDKDNNELHDVFKVTGYSANEFTQYSNVQVRVEGSFKVANIDDYCTGDDSHKGQDDYVNSDTIMRRRLENPITYVVTATKNLNFPIKDDAHGQLYEKLPDGSYKSLSVSMDMDMSASFNYFDTRNECPPLQMVNQYSGDTDEGSPENGKSYHYELWQSGGIPWNIGCGMDFILGGDAEKADSNVVALEITKLIVDESGKLIKPAQKMVNTMQVYCYTDTNGYHRYYNNEVANSVKDTNVEGYTADFNAGTYQQYHYLRDKEIEVGADGVGLVYDYAVKPGMYFITEKHGEDELTRQFTDVEGTQWSYKDTYITTEYVRREGYGNYDNKIVYPAPMHYSKTYTPEDAGLNGNPSINGTALEYASVPEVLGKFYVDPGNTIEKKNGFLEFFVYNVYKNDTTKLEVEKKWYPVDNPDAAPADASVTMELYYSTRPSGTQEEWTEPAPVKGAEGFDADLNTLMTLKANTNPGKNWKGKFTGLPHTITVGGVVYDVQYTVQEVAVTVNGVDVTEHFHPTIVRTDADDPDANGKVVVTNRQSDLNIIKKWYDKNGNEYTPAGSDNNVVLTAELWKTGTELSESVTVSIQAKTSNETNYTTLWSGLIKKDASLEFSVGAKDTTDVDRYKTELTGATLTKLGNNTRRIRYNTGRIKESDKAQIFSLSSFTADTTLKVNFPADKVGGDGIGYCITAVNESRQNSEKVKDVILNKDNGWSEHLDAEGLDSRYNYFIKPDTVQETGTGNRYTFEGPFIDMDEEGNKVIYFNNRLNEDYVSLDVEKLWIPEGTTPANTEVTVELMYAKRAKGSGTAWPDPGNFGAEGYLPVKDDHLFANKDIVTELVLNAASEWKGTFGDLPKTVVDSSTEYELEYVVRETLVMVDGKDVTLRYTKDGNNAVSYTKTVPDGGNAISNGKATVTNDNKTTRVSVRKAWDPMPTETDASVTVELRRFAKITDGSLVLMLTSQQTGAAIYGAEYELMKDGSSYETYTTDVNGRISVTGLSAGSYTLVQKSTPYGYTLPGNTTIDTFTITADTTADQTKRYNLTNEAQGTKGVLTLTLLDRMDGNPVQGATFTLKKDGSNYLEGLTTTSEGTITVEVQEGGVYQFVETNPANGYKTPDSTVASAEFTVTANYGNQYYSDTVYNQKIAKGMVTLTLKDSSGQPLQGATFTLGDATTYTTNGNGQFVVSDLSAGNYSFTQTSAPAGYDVSNEDMSFFIPDNGRTDNAAIVNVVNEEKSGNVTIRLWRKDSLNEFNWQQMQTRMKLKAGQTYRITAQFDPAVYPDHIWYAYDTGIDNYAGDGGHTLPALHALTDTDGNWKNVSVGNGTYTFSFIPAAEDTTYNLAIVTDWGIDRIKNVNFVNNDSGASGMASNAAPGRSMRAFSTSKKMYAAPVRNATTSIVGTDASPATPLDGYMEDSTFAPIEVTLSESNDWFHTFEPQALYDANGNNYYYYVVETAHSPEYYWIESYSAGVDGTITITNKNRAELEITKTVDGLPAADVTATFTFTVAGPGLGDSGKTFTKTWPTDFSNGTVSIKLTEQDGIRPGASYTVTESGSGLNITGYTRTTTVTSSSTATFAQNGNNPNGTTVIDAQTHKGSIAFANGYEQKTVDVAVNKVWAFANGSGSWPDGVTVRVELYSQTGTNSPFVTTGQNIDLTVDQPHYTFNSLPEYEGETKIQYCVLETNVTGIDRNRFEVSVSGNAATGFTITNTQKSASLTITKTFSGADLTDEQKNQIRFTVTGEGLPANGMTKTYEQFTNGAWTLTQDDGIVCGESYVVTEDNAAIGNYIRTTTIKVNDGAENVVENDQAIASNVVVDATSGAGTVDVDNHYDAPIDLNILKVDANDMTKPLAGAQFELCCVDETNASIQTETKIQAGLTGSDGKTAFTGLVSGYYMVEETVVPEGYILTSSRRFYIKVDIGATTDQIQLVDWNSAQQKWAPRAADPKLTFEAETSTVKVGNEPGASLPATGGPGTTLYYAAGAALLLLAIATLIFWKKADDE